MAGELTGKTVLITGGSSRLGHAFVLRALQQEARVFFTYHSHEEETRDLSDRGAEGFCLDLGDMGAIDDFSRRLRKELPALDVLIHNAAATRDISLIDMTEEDWDRVLTVDLKAPYFLTKKMIPLLYKAEQGKIFMITSRLAFAGGYGVSNYAAAKAGLIGLAKSLALEMGEKRILVNAVNPGFMKSRMTGNISEKALQKNLAMNPLGDASDPEQVADFLVYLSSPRMAQVTGQVFHFEGRQSP